MGSMSETLMAAKQVTLQYMGMLMTVIFRIAQGITARMGNLIGARDLINPTPSGSLLPERNPI